MKENYLITAFRATAARRFPPQAAALNAALEKRLGQLRLENAGEPKEKQFHLENQIMPGIAVYETLQSVMPKEEALQTVHGYVEERASAWGCMIAHNVLLFFLFTFLFRHKNPLERAYAAAAG